MKEPSATLDTNSEAAASNPGKVFFSHSIVNFFRFLLTRWWLFLMIGMVAGAGGFFYAKAQKVKYESNLTFVLQPGGNNSGVSGALSLAAQFGLNIGGGEDVFSGDNILEIIKSRRIVEQVFLSVDTFANKPYTLAEYYLHNPASDAKKTNTKIDDIHFLPGQSRKAFSYDQDSVLYVIFQNFATYNIETDRPDKKLSIFSIKITSDDEKFTKVFTDRIIHETDSFYIEICSKKERQTLEILEQRVASMRGSLSSSISSRAESQDANVNPAFAAAQVPLQQQQANIQVYGAAYAEMYKNLELARYQYLKKIPLMQVIDDAGYPMKKVKVSKLKMAIFFAFGAVFITVFIFWLGRIYKMNV